MDPGRMTTYGMCEETSGWRQATPVVAAVQTEMAI
jgi:hypothetical protein